MTVCSDRYSNTGMLLTENVIDLIRFTVKAGHGAYGGVEVETQSL